MKSTFLLLILAACMGLSANGQVLHARYAAYGDLILTGLGSAPFPHPQRAEGLRYRDSLYSAEEHYRDSTVAIFVPRGFKPGEKTDLLIHFHGWFNNVDSVLSQFRLIEQFSGSRKNAILVVPQGPRNAPDSFGGRLEDKGGFKRFVQDVLSFLVQQGRIPSATPGRIILSGHSGGYHVISYILLRGGMTENIAEIYLFDALYGQTEKYTHWLEDSKGKLLAIYTEDGGTKAETESLTADLEGWGIPFVAKNEEMITRHDLADNRIVLIFTPLGHNDVIHVHETFRKFLEASNLLDIH